MKMRKFTPDKTTYTCKCGHRISIPTCRGKALCDWCGRYVFIDEKREFKHRLIEERNKVMA